MIPVSLHDRLRVGYAFELVRKATACTMLSLEEVEKIVLRALGGEFDRDILVGPEKRPLSMVAHT